MTSIQINNRKYKLPSCWEELTWKQAVMLASLMIVNRAVGEPVSDHLKTLVLMLLWPDSDKWMHRFDDEQYQAMFETMNWIETYPKLPPVPFFKIGFFKYYLPAYNQLRAFEFAQADMYVRHWAQDQKIENLNALVATLMRPAKWWIRFFPFLKKWNCKWDGDVRVKFNSFIINAHKGKIANLNLFFKLYVLWWYLALKQHNKEVYKDLSGGKNDGEFIDALFSVAETGVFQDFEKVGQLPVATFFSYLRSKKKQNDHYERIAAAG